MTEHQRLISGFYFVYYGAAAILVPNLSLIFDDAGYSGSQIGWLIALPPAISAIAAPTWGGLADMTGRGRLLLSGALLGAGASALALGIVSVYTAAVAVMVVFALMLAPIVPFTDAASVEALEESSRYGRLRLWGAIGWGLAAPIAGWGIDQASLALAPVLFAFGMLILIMLNQRMPVAIQPTRLGRGLKAALAKSAGWVPLLAGALVTGITAGTIISYLFLLLRSLGASALTMGLHLRLQPSVNSSPSQRPGE